ncbi:MAG: energy transducer TonB [Candidatus Margulisiibacteriota bacterium]
MSIRLMATRNFLNTNLVVSFIILGLIFAGGRAMVNWSSCQVKASANFESMMVADYPVVKPLTMVKVLPAQLAQVMPPVAAPLPIMAPRLLQGVMPDYPAEARAQGIEGMVMLSLQIGPDGRVASSNVKQSSGFAVLDAAALHSAANWIFVPAQQGLANVLSVFEVPVSFRLDK